MSEQRVVCAEEQASCQVYSLRSSRERAHDGDQILDSEPRVQQGRKFHVELLLLEYPSDLVPPERLRCQPCSTEVSRAPARWPFFG